MSQPATAKWASLGDRQFEGGQPGNLLSRSLKGPRTGSCFDCSHYAALSKLVES